MTLAKDNVAQQLAHAAMEFEQKRTGHLPHSATVVISDGTLVITLHQALSPDEMALSRSAAGATQVQENYQQLFASSSQRLLQKVKRITGMNVCEAQAHVEPVSGAVVQAFTTGYDVQIHQFSKASVAGKPSEADEETVFKFQ